MTTRTLLIVVAPIALAAVAAAAKSDDIPPPPDVAAPPADAAKTPSGLATRVLQPGSGKQRPAIDDTVEVHYTGWTTDGKMFDSSVARGVPVRFPVRGVIKGWTEALQLMLVGEKRRLWIPANLAYGDAAGGGRPAGMLVFDVELVAITSTAQGARRRGRAAKECQAHEVRPRLPRSQKRNGQTTPEGRQHGRGDLHRLDAGREDVRQLGRPRRAASVHRQRRHRGVGGRASADGRGGQVSLLGSRKAGLRRLARIATCRGACSSSTSSSCRSADAFARGLPTRADRKLRAHPRSAHAICTGRARESRCLSDETRFGYKVARFFPEQSLRAFISGA